MKAWSMIGLISLGGLIEAYRNDPGGDGNVFGVLVVLSLLCWSWSAISQTALRLWSAVTGRRMPLAQTDPQALAVEVAALNAQITQLRDTATSFDVSFDHTLQRLDERLRRIEQQSTYAQPIISAGRHT